MHNITLDTITQAVINHGDRGKSHPRLYEVYTSLIQHLHDFVREVNLTESELQQDVILSIRQVITLKRFPLERSIC